MTYPDGIDALVNVNATDTLAAGGHAARHNSVNTALFEVKDYLSSSLVQPGVNLVAAQAINNVASISVNNCFTSTFRFYRIALRIFSSDGNGMTMRLRVGGSDASGSDYLQQVITANDTTLTGSRPAAATSWNIIASANTEYQSIDLLDPATAGITTGSAFGGNTVGGTPQIRLRYLQHSVSTAYDGFTLSAFTAGQTIGGLIRVYGYRDSL
jgi:hypothetical protein